MLQLWITIASTPPLDVTDQAAGIGIIMNSRFPIGSVNGRQLIRVLTTDIDAVITHFEDTLKSPTVCDVRHKNGVRYGFEYVQTGVDENENPIYEIQPVEEVTPYPMNDAERDLHMQPVELIDEEGNPYMLYPADNTTAGWAGWEDRLN